MNLFLKVLNILADENQTKGFIVQRAMFNALGLFYWKKPTIWTRSYKLLVIFLNILNLVTVYQATVNVKITDDRSFTQFIHNLMITMVFSSGFLKLILLHLSLGRHVASLIDYIEGMSSNCQKQPALFAMILYAFQMSMTGVGWAVHNIADGEHLLWIGEFPWDTYTKVGQLSAIVLQATSALLCYFEHYSVDTVLTIATTKVSINVDDLKKRIIKYGGKTEENYSIIKNSVNLHVAILKSVKLMNNAYRGLLGFQVMYMVCHSCVIFFTISKVANILFTLTSTGPLLVSALSQLYMFCAAGHSLTTETEELLFNCYESEWFRAPPKDRRQLCMIMEISKIPVIIKSYGVFNASRVTYLNAVRESSSYFVFLQTVASKIA